MRKAYNRTAAAELLRDKDTFAFVLMVIILSTYEADILDQDALEIFARLEEDFQTSISEENENRINAAVMALTTDLFYTSPEVFSAIAMALADGDIGDVVSGVIEEVSGAEALWAIIEVSLLTGENDMDLFSESVQRHVNDIIAGEALDAEEIDEDTDTVEEALKESYYRSYIATRGMEMLRQLKRLGAPESILAEIGEAAFDPAVK